jgi:ABC-2 type transport system permease protein
VGADDGPDLSLLGGVWFPVNSGTFHDIAEAPPSFWLVQASHLSIGGGGWSARGWLIMAAWSVVLAAAAGWAYRRDTSGCNGRTGARHRVRCQAPL